MGFFQLRLAAYLHNKKHAYSASPQPGRILIANFASYLNQCRLHHIYLVGHGNYNHLDMRRQEANFTAEL